MANPEEEERYEAFLERVGRTVLLDELTPFATKPVIESAFNQFGTVKDVIFLPTFMCPDTRVLLEMETEEMAKTVIATVKQFPFMVSGMPRPVRASASKPEMFHDRPKKPGKKIQFRWVNPKDTEFERAKKNKRLALKHSAESAYMAKKQLGETEKLASQQSEAVATHHKKFEMMDKLVHDRVAEDLASHYKIKSFPFR